MTFPPGGSGLRSASERPSGERRESWRSRAGTLAPGEERKRALQLRNVRSRSLCQQLRMDSSQLPTSASQTAQITARESPGIPPLPGFLKTRASFPWCWFPQSFL